MGKPNCEVCGRSNSWWTYCRGDGHKHWLCASCKRYLVEGPMVPHRREKDPRCPDLVTSADRAAMGLAPDTDP